MTRQTMVQLTEELVSLLDRRADRDGVSRSQIIREAVETYLHADREAELDRLIVDGYTRMPQGGEFDHDEWGDLGAFASAASSETLRRLDQEERDAGLSPW